MKLTSSQVSDFHRDGFLIAKLFDPDDFRPVKAEISTFLDARARVLLAGGLIRDLHADASFETRFGLLSRQSDEIHGGYDTTDVLGDAMFALMRHPKLLDSIESLVGGDISLNPIQHLRAKPPVSQSGGRQGFYEVPWHQDSGVTTADADGALLVAAWIPLCGATDEMGCLRFHPGFHRGGHAAHINDPRYGTTICPDLLPPDPPVVGVCAPGEVVLMSQFTPHMSTANRSGICRWSMDLRYQAVGAPSGRTWYPSTTVRSRQDPGSEVRDPAIWRAAWKDALSRPNPGVRHRIEGR